MPDSPQLKLILASRSPRRAQLLHSAGYAFEVRSQETDETHLPPETPVQYAQRVAAAKLAAVARGVNEVRIAADTTVWLNEDGPPTGKARDAKQAAQMLRSIGQVGGHFVTTAVALDSLALDEPPTLFFETTQVNFRPLSAQDIEDYLRRANWRDKAGAYGIQAEAASFVTRVQGSYTNVVGLPLAQVVQHLKKLGLQPTGPESAP